MRTRIVKKQPEMKLEIGVKISHARDNMWMAKDRSFPLFLSGETETVFILTAHLTGFRRDNVGMKINEEGRRITISWKKPVWEIVMRERTAHKEAKMVGFTKAFRIPDGVVLDRIEASFTEHDSTLTISLPKLVRGVGGINTIEQVDVVNEGEEPEPVQSSADNETPGDIKEQDIKEEPSVGGSKLPDKAADIGKKQEPNVDVQEPTKTELKQEQEPTPASPIEKEGNGEANLAEDESELEAWGFSKITGISALVITCIALVLHLTRTKKR